MKRIGSAIEGDALRAALEQFEANRQAREHAVPGSSQADSGSESKAGGKTQQQKTRRNSQEAPGAASDARSEVKSLERTKALQRAAKATQLEALAREAGMNPKAAAELADGLRAQAPTDWTFVMLSPSQHAAVVRWLTVNSSRPLVALNLWAHLFEVIRNDTGEVMASRAQLAAHMGVEPYHISRIMSELGIINAISRERSGRGVRYRMNSNVATHLPGNAARKLARETDGPVLALVQGGRAEPAAK